MLFSAIRDASRDPLNARIALFICGVTVVMIALAMAGADAVRANRAYMVLLAACALLGIFLLIQAFVAPPERANAILMSSASFGARTAGRGVRAAANAALGRGCGIAHETARRLAVSSGSQGIQSAVTGPRSRRTRDCRC